MSRNERTADRRRRRSALGVGTGAGAAFAAALISMGTAPAASAVVGDADLDGFQDLFGTGGINTWTAGADQGLAAVSPALASQLDTAVDAFRAVDQDPISNLAFAFDPTAFTGNPDLGGLPVTSMGDLAVGTDYLLSFSGLGATLDPIVDNLLGMPAPAALGEEPDLDGFQDLFGTGGINTWTAGADQGLAAVSPALAGQLDTAVDAFRAVDQDPISNLAFAFDPTAFTGNPDLGGLPVTSMGDLAVGTDYLLSFSGLGATLDPIIDNLLGMPMPL